MWFGQFVFDKGSMTEIMVLNVYTGREDGN